VTSNYGDLTAGEKLRLKLATTIALINAGFSHGVGRHPGLLFIDSPAAEEIPEANLETILTALQQVAADNDIQVFVATRYGNVVKKILSDDHVIVAEGEDPVW
jgi:ABC-type hemin transport system ATPase subunit